jgi:hypothetical protein
MPKVTTLGLLLVLGTGCTSQMARTPLQAMLLPPVDGRLALWVNQPAYFAVLGVGPERGTEVLYQQTALEAVPKSGYVYVPMRGDLDVDYEQVYLVASPSPIDLSAFPTTARDIDPAARVDFKAAYIVDGYQVDTVDRTVCAYHATLPEAGYPRDPFNPWRVYKTHVVLCERYHRSSPYIAPTRSFFTPMPKIYPPGKGKGVPPRPPKIEPKPEIDHAQALKSSSGWSPASSNWSRSDTRADYATHASSSARSEPPAVSRASSSAPSTSVSARPH